jgi:hypothetical protein
MTREEFGIGRCAAIQTIGGLETVQQHYAHAVHRSDQRAMQAALARREALLATLAQQMAALPPDDAAELAHRYPWITGSSPERSARQPESGRISHATGTGNEIGR